MIFTKMQGLGNDYLYVYGEVEDPSTLSQKLSERHFGAGSDGMIFILPSEVADFRMRIYNADGSEAAMCGNGIRCVGKYVYDKGYTGKTHLNIETMSGIRTLELTVVGDCVTEVSVDMGVTEVKAPMTLSVLGEQITCIPVSVGNPHAVVFVPDAEAVALSTVGPAIEKHEAFPGGVNAEFVQVIDNHTLRMRVWERGSGITMACGTGACASVSAAVTAGYCPRDEFISVHLDGGVLKIRVDAEGRVTMVGPAEFVYEGDVKL